MEAALVALCTDTLTHEAYVSQDGYGVPTYAAPVARLARVEYKLRRIVTAQGEERMSRARAFVPWDFPAEARDRWTLPDGTTPAVQLLYAVRDVDGSPSHYEISF